jgi:hypothetical protein
MCEFKKSIDMKFLTFEQIKAQLRLDDAQAELERTIITTHAEAAEDAVLNVCNRTITDIFETYGQIPSGLVVAALLLTDDMYNHRGTISPTSVQHLPAFDINVKPYIKLTTNNNQEYGKHCNL